MSAKTEIKKPNALAFMKALSKETGSEAFNESKMTEIDHWISTGNYALNRIVSGSIYKGFPGGIVSVLAGDSSSGKTLFACRLAANAVNENGYGAIIYIDSEGGANRSMFENVGLDTSLIQYLPVSNVEECTIKLIQTYKQIEKYQKETDPSFKCLIILDSLGALVSEKVLLDAENDKTAGDLGTHAKKTGSMIRAVTMLAKKTNCGLLMISQTYDDPGAMYKTKFMNMRGGKSVMYMPSLIVQLTRKLEKGTEKEDNFYEDALIRAFTVKTRNDVRPFLETELYLSFKNGFNGKEYFGLIPEAIRLGFITSPKQGWYCIPSAGDKQYRLKDLVGGPAAKKLWDTFIDEFDKASSAEVSYKRLSDVLADSLPDKIADELDED